MMWLTPWDPNVISPPEIYSEDHESSIFRRSSNPVCGSEYATLIVLRIDLCSPCCCRKMLGKIRLHVIFNLWTGRGCRSRLSYSVGPSSRGSTGPSCFRRPFHTLSRLDSQSSCAQSSRASPSQSSFWMSTRTCRK